MALTATGELARGAARPSRRFATPSAATLAQNARAGDAAATQTFLTVQALRAIAALLVVAYHAFDMWALRVRPGASWGNGAAGVDIFFVISGFVMVMSSQRLLGEPHAGLTFMRQRVVRIVPLYWLLTTLKLVLVFAFAGLALRSSLDLDTVVRSYLFLPVVDSAGHFRPLLPVGWTLTYEFLFYILFALALVLRVDVLRILVPAFAVIGALALLRHGDWPEWTILFSTIVFEFLFGVALAKLVLRGWSLPPAVAASVVFAGFALIFALPAGSENLRVLTWGIPALAIVAGAVSLEAKIAGRLPAWLLTLGDASYSIYLVHGFVLPVIGIAIARLHWDGYAAQTAAVLACLIAGALSGWLAYVCVERPMLRWMKRRSAH